MLNATVPDGSPAPGAIAATAAAIVLACTVSVIAVAALSTTWVTVLSEPAYVSGSAGVKLALITCAPGASAAPPGAVSAGSYSEMPFTLSFGGEFRTLENFLGRMQRFVTLKGDTILVNGRLMRVEAIDVEPGADGWPGLTAKITASTYIVPDDSTTASSATTPTTTTTTSTTGAASDHRPE